MGFSTMERALAGVAHTRLQTADLAPLAAMGVRCVPTIVPTAISCPALRVPELAREIHRHAKFAMSAT